MTLHYNLADLFECVADAVPDRTALVCGDRRLSFAETSRTRNYGANSNSKTPTITRTSRT